MKKVLLLSFVALLTFACNKLTDKNIVGTWLVTEFAINGTAQPSAGDVTYEFMDNGVMNAYIAGTPQGATNYTVSDDGNTLTMGGVNYTVTEKKGKTLKFEYNDQGDVYSWTLEKQ